MTRGEDWDRIFTFGTSADVRVNDRLQTESEIHLGNE